MAERPATPGTSPPHLSHLLRAIDRLWPGWEQEGGMEVRAPWGFLVGVETGDGRLVHQPLGTHPVRALDGWIAPGRWCAVGVAVRGTARRATETRPAEADARVVWLCHRDGRSASLLGIAGEPATVVVSPAGAPPRDEGRVPELLRAALAGHPAGLLRPSPST